MFEVITDHKYYDDGVCKDFIIKPLPETSKLLSGYKLLFRKEINGFRILFQAEENSRTPFLELDEGVIFIFSMQLKKPSLLNFTELPVKSSSNDIFYFETNDSSARIETDRFNIYKLKLAPDSLVQIRPKAFNYQFESESEEVKLQVLDANGKPILEKLLQSDHNAFGEQIDLNKFPGGKYTFRRIVNEEVEKVDYIFVTDIMRFGRPFGLITIYKDKFIKYEKPSLFKLTFQTRSVPWRYNLKLTNDYADHDFAITDKENYNNKNNSRYSEEVNFVETSNLDAYTKGATVIFESGEIVDGEFQPQKVPYYESPKKHLQLKTDNGKKTVINHLPNPAINNLKSEIFINV